MDLEPNIETLRWIISNADRAWEGGDFQALQYWEEQKQELYKKCQEKIKFLYYSLELIATQQDTLIQKVQRGEYSPQKANQINKQLYKQREDILIELNRYRNFLSVYESLASPRTPPFTHNSPQSGESIRDGKLDKFEEPVNTESLVKLIPPLSLSDILHLVIVLPLKKILLSSSGQIILFSLLISMSILGILMFYPDELQIKMQVEKEENSEIIKIVLVNNALWNARIFLKVPNKLAKSPTVYRLKMELLDGQDSSDILSSQIECVSRDMGSIFKLISSYVELMRGSREIILVDVGCLREYFSSPKVLRIQLYSTFPTRLISEGTIHLD
ncbi:MAG: hypothetical protein N3G21_06855 [Candidatus Hydrogenedentes bacterium]|nr:hypothetical protein [Candidatus Hydrogenedentota bacterium]